MMLWLKGCPRCRGDLTLIDEGFLNQRYVQCLQCGHILSGAHEAALLARSTARRCA
jgi:hypothetical protein